MKIEFLSTQDDETKKDVNAMRLITKKHVWQQRKMEKANLDLNVN